MRPLLHLLVSTIYSWRDEHRPPWCTRHKVLQFPWGSAGLILPLCWTTVLNRLAVVQNNNQPSAQEMQELIPIWNRLRRSSSGGGEQRREKGDGPPLSRGDSDLWRDGKCKKRANPSQSATMPSARLCWLQERIRAKARSWHQKANELTIGQGSPEYMQFDWEHLDRRIFWSVSFGFPPRFPSKVCDDISS